MKNPIVFVGICLFLLLSACSKNPKFEIEGTIRHAEGKTLYFELFGMDKTIILDSVKLQNEGRFHFKSKVPDAPEFYRLRIGDRFIHLGVDSAQSIDIEAGGAIFGKNYSVRGSRSCELIRDLSVLLDGTLLKTDSLKTLYNSKQLTITEFQEKLQTELDIHRKQAKKVIYENPRSSAAYFALFQRIQNYLIFDPYDKNDNKCYAAVATSWNTYYPESIRSKNLVNLTLQGIKEIRQARDAKDPVVHEINQLSFFEILLPNVYDKIIPLSASKGKVILLDFTVYQSESSPTRTLFFRELYYVYAEQGFEIYQVSLDTDEHFWKTGAANLPWICVHDKNCARSEYLTTYNVQSLPTYFLIDRDGNLVVRDVMVTDLNKEILKLL